MFLKIQTQSMEIYQKLPMLQSGIKEITFDINNKKSLERFMEKINKKGANLSLSTKDDKCIIKNNGSIIPRFNIYKMNQDIK